MASTPLSPGRMLLRGAGNRCSACGGGRLIAGWSRMAERSPSEAFGQSAALYDPQSSKRSGDRDLWGVHAGWFRVAELIVRPVDEVEPGDDST